MTSYSEIADARPVFLYCLLSWLKCLTMQASGQSIPTQSTESHLDRLSSTYNRPLKNSSKMHSMQVHPSSVCILKSASARIHPISRKDVRFQNYGLKSIEVVDNGTGIAPQDYDSIGERTPSCPTPSTCTRPLTCILEGLKHYTSKLSSFEDLTRVRTFGFRGEALSSLCALSDGVTVTTATASDAPMGTILEIDRNGRVKSRNGKVARQVCLCAS